MNEEQREDIEEALKFSNRNPKTKFHLRRVLGKETQFDEVNGHLFYPDSEQREGLESWCQSPGCELADRENAGKYDCPINMEGIHEPTDVF